MVRLLSKKPALLLWGLLIAICHGCTSTEAPTTVVAKDQAKQPMKKIITAEKKLNERSEVKPPADPNIVAIIGGYQIKKEELENRLMQELNPRYQQSYSQEAEPINAETVLKKMISEKAMVIDARKKNYLEDESPKQ